MGKFTLFTSRLMIAYIPHAHIFFVLSHAYTTYICFKRVHTTQLRCRWVSLSVHWLTSSYSPKAASQFLSAIAYCQIMPIGRARYHCLGIAPNVPPDFSGGMWVHDSHWHISTYDLYWMSDTTSCLCYLVHIH